ncbi:MAG: hypothetical protein A4E63_00013 [Syntrophorhabdus sp. PtaU1.Bin050]|nr:MAG: hypothetical protein A4E63_00013 [Syntrophorhabdus sp. PtaU1.Bin050]
MRVQRRINYTGRKKIDRSMVQITLVKDKGERLSFAASLDLSDLKLKNDAKVFIEPYHLSSRQRFDFGTVDSIRSPENTTLSEIDADMPVLFDIKVVDTDEAHGLLLAYGKARPSNDAVPSDREFLIRVKTMNLQSIPWKICFYEDEKPELILNSQIPAAISQLKENPVFRALLLPAIIHQVYSYIFGVSDGGPGEDSWQQKWIDFGEKLAGQVKEDPEERLTWIDDVVERFSSLHGLAERVVKMSYGDGV